MQTSIWGDEQTQYFYRLTPDVLLNALESSLDLRCTGRVQTLNSMENRVYEIEIEDQNSGNITPLIAKFYRPGRWSREQILEEHAFLGDLEKAEIPCIVPLRFKDGDTLHRLAEVQIYYAVFPKFSGRAPDELSDDEYRQVGRLLARIHAVGAINKCLHRIQLDCNTYGHAHLKYLIEHKFLPNNIESAYKETLLQIFELIEPLFDRFRPKFQRIHGDCHFGNLLRRGSSFFWVDFDDFVLGPTIQDLWLLLPGRDDTAKMKLRYLLEGYEQMNSFDHQSLILIEPLRTLRMVHFSAWIARRWEDPSFQRAFSYFAEPRYWFEQLQDMRDQFLIIKQQQQDNLWS